MQDAHFRPTAAERFGNDGLRAPVRKRVPDADNQLCLGWVSPAHSLDLLCRHQRNRPTMRPRPTVPTMKGRAIGMASHATTTNPMETTAPARVPGTLSPPYLPM